MQQAALEFEARQANKKPYIATLIEEYQYEEPRAIEVTKVDDEEYDNLNAVSKCHIASRDKMDPETDMQLAPSLRIRRSSSHVGNATRSAMSSETATRGKQESLNARTQDPLTAALKFRRWTPTWMKELNR